jgi:glutamate-ammonia-ligase adenylyltransferase
MVDDFGTGISAFVDGLPDPEGARLFQAMLHDRLSAEAPETYETLRRNPQLLCHLLTLATHSTAQAQLLISRPEYIEWLNTQAGPELSLVKTKEQFSQELARFCARRLSRSEPQRLSEFKRRELLRTYLRDVEGIASLSEITEELSNLADVLLSEAVSFGERDLTRLYGQPLARDGAGRLVASEFAIIALGKLGCRELNYSSDIDLLCIYSQAGDTGSSKPVPVSHLTGQIDSQQYFTKLAEQVIKTIGATGEGSVYRVDMRLRPYGRDGDLVWEAARAADYYRKKAHNWERQALIRARVAAGSINAGNRFLDLIRDVVFRPDALPGFIGDLRRAREMIDRKAAGRAGGFNVKLGKGGIREIEFIAQALQTIFGGREPWVRSSQTLIVLARLAEKGYLSELERARLTSAYTFLRTVEHRLQMDQGAQTHTLPTKPEALALVARRCGYLTGKHSARELIADMESHTAAVRAIYNRVVGDAPSDLPAVEPAMAPEDSSGHLVRRTAEGVMSFGLTARGQLFEAATIDHIEQTIRNALPVTIDPVRSLRNLANWSDSLSASETRYGLRSTTIEIESLPDPSSPEFRQLIEGLARAFSSEYLAAILLARPLLATELRRPPANLTKHVLVELLQASIDNAPTVAGKGDELRRAWRRRILEIGYEDVLAAGAAGDHSSDALRINNLKQTTLAEAVLDLATEIALDWPGSRRAQSKDLPFAILALGRLGHAGMDYGSDLDLIVVFDDRDSDRGFKHGADAELMGRWSRQEFFGRFTASLVKLLSSVTREGFLYRVDLRLRPDGKSGIAAQGFSSLISYLSERASAWEHSAYLKAREVAGNLEFGRLVRLGVSDAVFNAAAKNSHLKQDLRAMRARLENEKARGNKQDIKWGPGGMTDVYFITRYLQLRDRISFPTEQGTTALISHLNKVGALRHEDAESLFEGYAFLRRLDHWMRLLLDRPRGVFPSSQSAIEDISRAMAASSSQQLEGDYRFHTSRIRAAYDSIFE